MKKSELRQIIKEELGKINEVGINEAPKKISDADRKKFAALLQKESARLDKVIKKLKSDLDKELKTTLAVIDKYPAGADDEAMDNLTFGVKYVQRGVDHFLNTVMKSLSEKLKEYK